MTAIGLNRDADAGPPLVLVAESHGALSEALAPWLSASLAPCRVLTVETGEACVEAVRAHHPRAVLIGMPLIGMSAIEAARRITTTWPDTAVIMLSLYDAAAYRAEAHRAGACDYVLKSHVAHDLLPRLRPLLRARRPGRILPRTTAAPTHPPLASES